VTEGAGAKL